MKKTLALILALIMCCSVFVACGEDKEPQKDPAADASDNQTPDGNKTPDNTETPDGNKTPDDTQTPDDTEPEQTVGKPVLPELPTDANIVSATFDMTDNCTLVIANPGSSGTDRNGTLAAAGKVQAGVYNAAGLKRTSFYEWDFASLNLEGEAWEYLGALVQIDISDPANPKIVNTLEKSTFYVNFSDISLSSADNTATLTNGQVFDIAQLNYGIIRNNHLLNEGGKFVTGWDDTDAINTTTGFTFKNPAYQADKYIFTRASYLDIWTGKYATKDMLCCVGALQFVE